MSQFVQVSKSQYRSVQSDVLPYEHPIFFSNRFFARFLKYYGVCVQNGRLAATKHTEDEGLNGFLLILGGNKDSLRRSFQYQILKGNNARRTLTIIHPYHQVRLAEFYERYNRLLIAFCSRSHFSLRYPYKVATYQNVKQGYHKLLTDEDERENVADRLKHYFCYQRYNNINEFYGDYRFLRAEKQFSQLWKVDLKNCFDNIIPEDLSKAIFGVDMSNASESIADAFCQIQKDSIQTRGIVIGPEFSRIYAEIILQAVDVAVERSMKDKGFLRSRDYRFYRYVDDGFLFYSDDVVWKNFKRVYQVELDKYQLKFNQKKTLLIQRPFVGPISAIKDHLRSSVVEFFSNRLDTFEGFKRRQNGVFESPLVVDYKDFINRVRCLMATPELPNPNRAKAKTAEPVSYNQIMGYLLNLIRTHLEKLLSDYNTLYRQYKDSYMQFDIDEQGMRILTLFEQTFVVFAKELTEILFYLLSVDARMTTSIKVVSQLNLLQLFVRGRYCLGEKVRSQKFTEVQIQALDRKISDETATFLKSGIGNSAYLMERLNILELQKLMSPTNRISPAVLNQCLANRDGQKVSLNYFSAFELLHFCQQNAVYNPIKQTVLDWIAKTIKPLRDPKISDTESVLTFMEALCCPWIAQDVKLNWLRDWLGEHNSHRIVQFAQRQKQIFIKWHHYKLMDEMQYSHSSEVY